VGIGYRDVAARRKRDAPSQGGGYGGSMPDEIFAHPSLARIYDAFDGNRDDLDLYVDLIRGLDARHVLDIGCGTGSLPVLLARCGVKVTAVDPALGSLEVARSKDGADRVTWILGDATTLPALQVDVVVMTGNVAQVFLSDAEWTATLQGIREAIAPGGRFVFETRRPERRAWETWAIITGPVVREVDGVGEVEQRRDVTDVAPPYVSFRYSYRFSRDAQTVTSDSTLRFRSRDEIERSLNDAGFNILDVLDAPDRPGHEYVVIAELTAG
jgi:SAM-dependent methyltransferase